MNIKQTLYTDKSNYKLKYLKTNKQNKKIQKKQHELVTHIQNCHTRLALTTARPQVQFFFGNTH